MKTGTENLSLSKRITLLLLGLAGLAGCFAALAKGSIGVTYRFSDTIDHVTGGPMLVLVALFMVVFAGMVIVGFSSLFSAPGSEEQRVENDVEESPYWD